MTLNWGIAGASKISSDFCKALRSQLTANKDHEVVAIASRRIESAQQFAKEHKIAKAYDSYLDLAKDNDVQIVYVAVLNPKHYEVARCMIEHGKHVLCEKPFCMNYAQAKELFTLAAKHQVFLMEGMWSRFFPVYRQLDALFGAELKDEIKEVSIKHGFSGSSSARIITKEMGGGIVLDIGCYAIQLVLFTFRERPTSIRATGQLNSEGVDMYFEAEMIFSGGRKAKIICSGLEELENQAKITTTKGEITIPTYWCPTKCVALGEIYEWNLDSENSETYFYTHSIGLKYEADEVYKNIISGQKSSSIMPPEDTLLIAEIQDGIRKQIGVQYDCDKKN